MARKFNVVLSGRGRALAAIGGVIVVAGVSVAAGLTLGQSGPAVAAAPQDRFAVAPDCGKVSLSALREAVPEAALRSEDRGPLTNASANSCLWSTPAGAADERAMRVDFEAHFTRSAGEVSGSAAAENTLSDLAALGGLAGTQPVPELGEGAVVWPSSAGEGSVELAFRRENLLVRVWFGGYEEGEPLAYETARDTVIEAAARFDAAQ